MTNIDDITIGEAKHLSRIFCGPINAGGAIDCGLNIVILQRGWIAIGHLFQYSNKIEILNAAIIRNWGTTKGLGQLAMEGAQPNTKLDDCGKIEAHPLSVVLTIPIKEGLFSERKYK